MLLAVLLGHDAIRSLPDRKAMAPAVVPLRFGPVALAETRPPLRLAGAWTLSAPDNRFTGLSALAIDGQQLLAVSDRGAAIRFDPPAASRPKAWISDLVDGPGKWGEKRARDAESLARDAGGRGWWVGFEQCHALFLYEPGFARALSRIDLGRRWPPNRGAEGLLAGPGGLAVFPENGRELLAISAEGLTRMPLAGVAEIADAAVAPDGGSWLLLRSWSLGGIRQSLAPLAKDENGWRLGPAMTLPGGPLDNFEGLAIAMRPGGGWRFWVVSDDGHRFLARTLLVALDYDPPGHKKSPAQGAGPSTAGSGG